MTLGIRSYKHDNSVYKGKHTSLKSEICYDIIQILWPTCYSSKPTKIFIS